MLTRTGYGRRAYITAAARNNTDWVLTDASLDLDFANDRYYDGELAALAAIVTVSRAGAATYRDASGLIQSAAANSARIDHGLGLLIEETRTNICTYSGALDNAAWVKSGATASANAATSPDGTANADTLGDNSATGTGTVSASQTITVSTSTAYSFSVFCKAGQLSWVRIGVANFTAPADSGAWFNLSTGAAGAVDTALDNSGIEDYGNGWYRCRVSFTTDAADTTGDITITVCDADNDVTVDLDGTSDIYVWGAQCEAGAFPTSYIPTSGSSVTRNEDNAQIAALGSWFNATEGGVYAEADTSNWASGNNRVYMIQSNTQNRMEMKNNGGSGLKYETRVGNNRVVEEYPGTPAGIAKTAMRYKNNDYGIALDGGAVETDTNAAVPSVSKANLGTYDNTSEHLNGHMKRLAIFNTAPDNTKLQTLTS